MKPGLHFSTTDDLSTTRSGRFRQAAWRNKFSRLAVNYLSKLFILVFMDLYPSLKH